jgi:hypothetical protein
MLTKVQIFGVFEYINDGGISSLFLSIFESQLQMLQQFEQLLGDNFAAGGLPRPNFQLTNVVWREFMTHHVDRMERFTQFWLERSLGELRTTWTSRLEELLTARPAPDPADVDFALQMLEGIEKRIGEIETKIKINFSGDL